jgi:hypothetical protein
MAGNEPEAELHSGFSTAPFRSGGGEALVYEVVPATAFGFAKGVYSQTRWRFERA